MDNNKINQQAGSQSTTKHGIGQDTNAPRKDKGSFTGQNRPAQPGSQKDLGRGHNDKR